MSMMTFNEEVSRMKLHGMKLPGERLHIQIPNARDVLYGALNYFIAGEEGKHVQWLPEYENVASWMEDNQRRGLFLYGSCGRGKSILCRYVLPAILLKFYGKVVTVMDIQEMNTQLDTALKKQFLSLDDIGTEDAIVNYGERRMAFAEIMDQVEKHGKLVIVSSNLDGKNLSKMYGDRVLDRIKATTVRVKFEGESLRK